MNPANEYRTYRILRIRNDNYRTKTFFLDGELACLPGQYCMLWLPGVDEKPFSIMDGNPLTFNIAAVGEFTRAVHELREGNEFSVRGPYGTNFTPPKKGSRVLLVGGGYGVAPLLFFARACIAAGAQPFMMTGARTKEEVLLEEDFRKAGVPPTITTNDGTQGLKGVSTDAARQMLAHEKIDKVYSCGPEKMMSALEKLCMDASVPCELSLERYMGCSMGMCGKCVVDGVRCCTEGPVMAGTAAKQLSEFGSIRRLGTGEKKPW